MKELVEIGRGEIVDVELVNPEGAEEKDEVADKEDEEDVGEGRDKDAEETEGEDVESDGDDLGKGEAKEKAEKQLKRQEEALKRQDKAFQLQNERIDRLEGLLREILKKLDK